MRLPLLWLPLLLALLPACLSTHYTHTLGEEGTALAKTRGEGNAEVAWTLYPSSRESQPLLGRTTTVTSEVAHVGLSVRSIDAKQSESLGVEPWRGVQVSRVVKDSPAARAGIQVKDVILSIEETPVTNDAQFIEIVQVSLSPTSPVRFEVLRGASSEGRGQVIEVLVTPDGKPLTETQTDSFKLETEQELLTRTGMQLATIPELYAGPIYGEASSAVVVSGVVVGSPAYDAGLRGGDRVLNCNGLPVSTAREVKDMLGVPGARPPGSPAEEGPVSALDLEVQGPLGSHRARVAVVPGIYGNSSLNIPILFDYDSDVDSTRWSLLDFIFQFGANYSSRSLRSPTREARSSWELSLFPLGMFEFERSPSGSRTTLFWLIDFKSN